MLCGLCRVILVRAFCPFPFPISAILPYLARCNGLVDDIVNQLLLRAASDLERKNKKKKELGRDRGG